MNRDPLGRSLAVSVWRSWCGAKPMPAPRLSGKPAMTDAAQEALEEAEVDEENVTAER
jgi:hypothetical protein